MTIPFPIDKPDSNGFVYSEKAVANAINNLKNLPIIYRDNKENTDGVVIGHTGESYATIWNHENQVCNIIIDGELFYGSTECIVREVKNGVVTDFKITGIGMSR